MCSYVSGTFHCTVQIGTDFVNAYNKYDFSWSLSDAGNAIGISINIYQNTIAVKDAYIP